MVSDGISVYCTWKKSPPCTRQISVNHDSILCGIILKLEMSRYLQSWSLFHHVTVILRFLIRQGARASLGHIASHVPWSLLSLHARAPDSFTRLEAWGSNQLNICQYLYDLKLSDFLWFSVVTDLSQFSMQRPELAHTSVNNCEQHVLYTNCPTL